MPSSCLPPDPCAAPCAESARAGWSPAVGGGGCLAVTLLKRPAVSPWAARLLFPCLGGAVGIRHAGSYPLAPSVRRSFAQASLCLGRRVCASGVRRRKLPPYYLRTFSEPSGGVRSVTVPDAKCPRTKHKHPPELWRTLEGVTLALTMLFLSRLKTNKK